VKARYLTGKEFMRESIRGSDSLLKAVLKRKPGKRERGPSL
jgi:hypothetical protein